MQLCLARAEVDLLGYPLAAQLHGYDGHLSAYSRASQRGRAATPRPLATICIMMSVVSMVLWRLGQCLWAAKLGIDIEPVYGHGIGNQHLARQITWLDMAGLGQGVIRSHHQHLLIVKDGLKVQTRLEQRIGVTSMSIS